MSDAVGGHAMLTPGLARLSSPRGLWLVGLLALVLASSVFLVEGTQVRVQDPAVWALYQPPVAGVQPQGLSIDGMAFMRGWYPGDYAAINWINAQGTNRWFLRFAPKAAHAPFERPPNNLHTYGATTTDSQKYKAMIQEIGRAHV